MAKRLLFMVVCAGLGSLAGLLAAFLGAGNIAIVAGCALGAVIPLFLGPPGK